MAGYRCPVSIRIEPRRLSELTEMTARQQTEMAARYGGEGGSGAPPRDEEFVPPEGVFLVALREGEVIGCGGICRHPEGGGEIRRMYVAPEARGSGVGRTVLEALEQWAVDLGFETPAARDRRPAARRHPPLRAGRLPARSLLGAVPDRSQERLLSEAALAGVATSPSHRSRTPCRACRRSRAAWSARRPPRTCAWCRARPRPPRRWRRSPSRRSG